MSPLVGPKLAEEAHRRFTIIGIFYKRVAAVPEAGARFHSAASRAACNERLSERWLSGGKQQSRTMVLLEGVMNFSSEKVAFWHGNSKTIPK
jgi:hypothetical protein